MKSRLSSSSNTVRSARSPNISPRSRARGAACRRRRAAKSSHAARASTSTSSTPESICARYFPPDEFQWDAAKIDTWSWDAYLAAAEKLFKAGYPVGLGMGQTSDFVDWVGALFSAFGVVMVDAKDNIRINSDETRAVLEYAKKLMAAMPPDVYAWDDAGNNRWLISGKGAGIMNPPSAWAVAKRDNPKVAENCWTHPMPRGPKGRFVGQLPQFYGLWSFSRNKPAAKELLLYLSQKPQVARLVQASFGFDLPSFRSMYDLDTWKTVEPPLGTVYGYPPRADEQTSIAAAPARSEVGGRRSTIRPSTP